MMDAIKSVRLFNYYHQLQVMAFVRSKGCPFYDNIPLSFIDKELAKTQAKSNSLHLTAEWSLQLHEFAFPQDVIMDHVSQVSQFSQR